MAGAPEIVSTMLADWRWHAPKDLSERIPQAARLAVTFSFQPHYAFYKDTPTFGY